MPNFVRRENREKLEAARLAEFEIFKLSQRLTHKQALEIATELLRRLLQDGITGADMPAPQHKARAVRTALRLLAGN